METLKLPPTPETEERLLSLWNRCLGSSFPLDLRLLRQRTGRLGGGALLLAAPGPGGAFAGAVLAKRPLPAYGGPTTGYIGFILVAPESHGKGLGSRLLEAAESWCREGGAERLRIGSDPDHLLPGLPLEESSSPAEARPFFEVRGFAEDGIEEDLIADLGNLNLDAARGLQPPNEDYQFSLCSPGLRAGLDSFLASSFPGRWREDVAEGFASGSRDEDFVLLLERDTAGVRGFARICDLSSPDLIPGLFWRPLMGPKPGALGPIGLDSSARGKGLGLGLLARSLAELKKRGARNTVIDWTDLGRFYATFGFSPWKRYLMLSKRLG